MQNRTAMESPIIFSKFLNLSLFFLPTQICISRPFGRASILIAKVIYALLENGKILFVSTARAASGIEWACERRFVCSTRLLILERVNMCIMRGYPTEGHSGGG